MKVTLLWNTEIKKKHWNKKWDEMNFTKYQKFSMKLTLHWYTTIPQMQDEIIFALKYWLYHKCRMKLTFHRNTNNITHACEINLTLKCWQCHKCMVKWTLHWNTDNITNAGWILLYIEKLLISQMQDEMNCALKW